MKPDAVQVSDDRLEVTIEDGQRFTFPIAELRATRRAPRPNGPSRALPVNVWLAALEAAKRTAETYAVEHRLI